MEGDGGVDVEPERELLVRLMQVLIALRYILLRYVTLRYVTLCYVKCAELCVCVP
jgi:hypothetical protein